MTIICFDSGVGAPSSEDRDTVSSSTAPSSTTTTTSQPHRVKRSSSRLMTGGGVRQRTRGPVHSRQPDQQTLIQCPLCGRQFARNVVEIHASTCEGRDTTETDASQVQTVRWKIVRPVNAYSQLTNNIHTLLVVGWIKQGILSSVSQNNSSKNSKIWYRTTQNPETFEIWMLRTFSWMVWLGRCH